MPRTLLSLVVCSCIGCSPEAAPAAADGPTPVLASPSGADVPVAPISAAVPAAPREPAPDDGPLGVKECDEYLALFQACIDGRIDADEREAQAGVLAGQRLAWRRASADPRAAGELPAACRTARAAAKVSLPQCPGW